MNLGSFLKMSDLFSLFFCDFRLGTATVKESSAFLNTLRSREQAVFVAAFGLSPWGR